MKWLPLRQENWRNMDDLDKKGLALLIFAIIILIFGMYLFFKDPAIPQEQISFSNLTSAVHASCAVGCSFMQSVELNVSRESFSFALSDMNESERVVINNNINQCIDLCGSEARNISLDILEVQHAV